MLVTYCKTRLSNPNSVSEHSMLYNYHFTLCNAFIRGVNPVTQVQNLPGKHKVHFGSRIQLLNAKKAVEQLIYTFIIDQCKLHGIKFPVV